MRRHQIFLREFQSKCNSSNLGAAVYCASNVTPNVIYQMLSTSKFNCHLWNKHYSDFFYDKKLFQYVFLCPCYHQYVMKNWMCIRIWGGVLLSEECILIRLCPSLSRGTFICQEGRRRAAGVERRGGSHCPRFGMGLRTYQMKWAWGHWIAKRKQIWNKGKLDKCYIGWICSSASSPSQSPNQMINDKWPEGIPALWCCTINYHHLSLSH